MKFLAYTACTKVELWDPTVCIAANEKTFRSCAVTLTLVRQYPISNLSEIVSYTTMYLNFMLVDRLPFELSCKNTHKYTPSFLTQQSCPEGHRLRHCDPLYGE